MNEMSAADTAGVIVSVLVVLAIFFFIGYRVGYAFGYYRFENEEKTEPQAVVQQSADDEDCAEGCG